MGIIGALVILVVCFLLGSFPSGVVIGKVFYHTDIRKQGSGNIGTTNAIRALGKKGGYAVFILDFGKGLLSGFVGVWLYGLFSGDAQAMFTLADGMCFSFLGCGMGHIFSPWLGFKGGKGIAVCVGCLFVVFGFIGAWIELGIFIVLVIATRYVSVGSIAAAVLCPFLALHYFWGDWLAVVMCLIMALTVIWAHRENISRLRSGTERRIGDKKE